MKNRTLLILILLFSTTQLFAQEQGVGLHFGAYDFYGPQTGGNYFFVSQNRIKYGADNAKNDTTKVSKLLWQPMVKITYWLQLNKWLDVNLGLSLADAEYPNSKKDSAFIQRQINNYGAANRTDQFLGELDARINFNILPRQKYMASPYIFAGITAAYHPIYFGADFPVGLGLNLHPRKKTDVNLNLEAGYKAALTTNDYDHLQYSVGFVYWFKPGYKKPKPAEVLAEVLPPPDMDHDGVPDSIDKCPTIPGQPEFDGCPDSDGDGIPDNIDECPLVAGAKAFNGCPDSDGDGIPDNKDRCPYQAGTADNGGCPPPDRDHDGVPDAQDKCPDEAGPASNNGCPEVKKEVIEMVQKEAHSVFFETGKATLKKTSYTSLNHIAEALKNNPSYKIDIAGYTDNVGKPERNVELSQQRADACRTYLISQGINADRITAKGYGEANPIADNKTKLGRAQNRRTEFKLHN